MARHRWNCPGYVACCCLLGMYLYKNFGNELSLWRDLKKLIGNMTNDVGLWKGPRNTPNSYVTDSTHGYIKQQEKKQVDNEVRQVMVFLSCTTFARAYDFLTGP